MIQVKSVVSFIVLAILGSCVHWYLNYEFDINND